MNRHERRAQAKANARAGKLAPALAVLHAAALKNALDGRFLEALSTCQQTLALFCARHYGLLARRSICLAIGAQ